MSESPHPADLLPATAPRFGEALRWWLKLGCISFGGPAGQIALMHDELVEKRRWIDEARFVHALNYCMLLPGPEAQQLATYIGWRLHGVRGGVAAGVLFVLPSLLLLLALSWLYIAYHHLPAIQDVLLGLRAAVVAIIAAAAWRLAARLLERPLQWAIALLALLGLLWGRLPYPWLIALAAGIGWLGLRGTAAALPTAGTAPMAVRAPAAWRAAAIVFGICLLLWTAVYLLLPAGTLREMALFFTRAAFLTFGGAYAVLPYVNAAAVQQYGWLAQGQMVDGLALGETTPGPLIMVVAFVGFLGGWQSHPEAPLAMALAGGLVATLYTFLPSFLLVLAGAPLIEASRGRAGLAAPLAGIQAAVIGVIAHLALTFGRATLLPEGRLDVFALLLAAIALWGMRRHGLGVAAILLLCALAGLLRGAWALP